MDKETAATFADTYEKVPRGNCTGSAPANYIDLFLYQKIFDSLFHPLTWKINDFSLTLKNVLHKQDNTRNVPFCFLHV